MLICRFRGGGAARFAGGRGSDRFGVGDVGDAFRSCSDGFFSSLCGLAGTSLPLMDGVGRATGMVIDPLSIDLRRSGEPSPTRVARPDGTRLACGLAGSTVRLRAMLGESRIVGRSSVMGAGENERGISMDRGCSCLLPDEAVLDDDDGCIGIEGGMGKAAKVAMVGSPGWVDANGEMGDRDGRGGRDRDGGGKTGRVKLRGDVARLVCVLDPGKSARLLDSFRRLGSLLESSKLRRDRSGARKADVVDCCCGRDGDVEVELCCCSRRDDRCDCRDEGDGSAKVFDRFSNDPRCNVGYANVGRLCTESEAAVMIVLQGVGTVWKEGQGDAFLS